MSKDKILTEGEREYKPLLLSFGISALFVVFVVLLGMCWESDDDAAISLLLSRKGNGYSPFQWRGLSIILHFLYMHFPVLDWWAVNSVLAIAAGLGACVYVVYRRFAKGQATAISIMLVVFVWIAAANRMNFTRTAAVVAMGGCLLIADSIFKSLLKNPVEFGLGCFLLLYGASIRYQSAMIALGFLAVMGGVRLLFDHFCPTLAWFKAHRRQILGLLLAAVIFFAAYGIDQLTLTADQRAYLEYNGLRAKIQDYPYTYPLYVEAAQEYADAGLEQIDVEYFFDWFSEETDVMTTDALRGVVALREWRWSLDELKESVKGNATPILLVAVLLVLLGARRKQNLLRIAFPAVLVVACSLLLACNGRIPLRVVASLLIACFFSSIFLSGEDEIVQGSAKKEKRKDRVWTAHRLKDCVLLASYVLGVVAFLCAVRTNFTWSLEYLNRPWQVDEQARYHAQRSEMINSDKEHIYICDLYGRPANLAFSFSFWEPKPSEYCDNYFCLGGWDARHPYKVKLLEEQGITNPVRALIEKTDVYSVYTSRLHKYLRVKYDGRITASEIENRGGIGFVQYCAPIEDSQLTQGEQTATLEAFSYEKRGEMDAWRLELRLDPTENTGKRVFYCNVTVEGTRYTFRMQDTGETATAYLYGLNEEFDASSADIVLFELTQDGKYVRYTTN